MQDNKEISLVDSVKSSLKRVVDPEIGINIVDLGLVYEIDVNQENDVQVLMTLTAPNCPFGDMIMMETEFAVRSVKDVNLVKINLTFDPPWNPDQHVSDEAKYQMGLL
jgi:metal-sulfur cluster biosynthetic enzyme|tara:strand:- start:665 stop:988 length:324 start_codon:yes stop_codon:yes gene_type:complete